MLPGPCPRRADRAPARPGAVGREAREGPRRPRSRARAPGGPQVALATTTRALQRQQPPLCITPRIPPHLKLTQSALMTCWLGLPSHLRPTQRPVLHFRAPVRGATVQRPAPPAPLPCLVGIRAPLRGVQPGARQESDAARRRHSAPSRRPSPRRSMRGGRRRRAAEASCVAAQRFEARGAQAMGGERAAVGGGDGNLHWQGARWRCPQGARLRSRRGGMGSLGCLGEAGGGRRSRQGPRLCYPRGRRCAASRRPARYHYLDGANLSRQKGFRGYTAGFRLRRGNRVQSASLLRPCCDAAVQNRQKGFSVVLPRSGCDATIDRGVHAGGDLCVSQSRGRWLGLLRSSPKRISYRFSAK